MDEAKHTPGTWSFHRKLCGRDDVIVSDDAERTVIAVAHRPPAGVEQMAANGHLMAAAPDLLAACRAVREELIGHMTGAWPGTMSITAKRIGQMLAAAIAKVEGNQP